jgi:FKBP-type peptidyl-prolyl cis-trans isomerase SlpA
MNNVIQPGSRVTLHYTLSLGDGTPVDSTRETGPATLTLGSGELVGILEQRLLGLQEGERRHFTISATESRMPGSDDMLQSLARSDFPPDMALEAGQVLGFATPSGEEVPGLLVSVSDNEVIVDFSHPLAGRDLIFDVEILAVESA